MKRSVLVSMLRFTSLLISLKYCHSLKCAVCYHPRDPEPCRVSDYETMRKLDCNSPYLISQSRKFMNDNKIVLRNYYRQTTPSTKFHCLTIFGKMYDAERPNARPKEVGWRSCTEMDCRQIAESAPSTFDIIFCVICDEDICNGIGVVYVPLKVALHAALAVAVGAFCRNLLP